MAHPWPLCRHSDTGFFDGTRTVVGRLGTVLGAMEFVIQARLTDMAGREAMIHLLLDTLQDDQPRDLAVAEIAQGLGPVELGTNETLVCLEMRERAQHLAALYDSTRDLPQLESICKGATQCDGQLQRFAAIALGVYTLRGWAGRDRYTLAKWQLFLSTYDHGRHFLVPYNEVPRDLFDVFGTTELLAGWLEEFTVVRDQARV